MGLDEILVNSALGLLLRFRLHLQQAEVNSIYLKRNSRVVIEPVDDNSVYNIQQKRVWGVLEELRTL